MSEYTVINGKTWSPAAEDQQADASGSGYILIRTDGSPLNKVQKTEIKSLGVQIHEFLGGGDCCEDDEDQQQIYLCGYPKGSPLEPIRALGYIDYADVYSDDLAIHDAVERLRARPVAHRANANGAPGSDTPSDYVATNRADAVSARTAPPMSYTQAANGLAHVAAGDKTVEVDVLLHHDIYEVPQELIDKIRAVDGLKELTTDDASCVVRLKIDEDALESIASLDEVRVIHPVNERVLMTNIARGVMGFPVETPIAAYDVTPFHSPCCRYQGHDQLVCVADTGFDKGSTTDVHDAFTGRVKALHPWGRKGAADDPDGHGTHVCG